MSKFIKAASSVGSAALLLSGAAMAAPPIAFDGWTVTSGTIATSACVTASWTCGTPVTGLGFYQRQITRKSDGASFFQTIITEENANGALADLAFSDESFVRTGNNSGLADKQRINNIDAPSATVFKTSSEVASGWAGDSLNIAQSVYSYDTVANTPNVRDGNFGSDFFFDQTGTNAAPTAQRMKISGHVNLGAVGDNQDFVLSQQQGTYVAANGSVTLTGGGTVSWLAGEKIKGIWVGQDMVSIGQTFGYTSFDNVTTAAADRQFVFSLTSSAADQWPAVFGSRLTDGTGF